MGPAAHCIAYSKFILQHSVGKNRRKQQSSQEICSGRILEQDNSANFTMEIGDSAEASAILTEVWCCVLP
jgi:hypothetical protein